MGTNVTKKNQIFFNHSFDKKRLKALISWVFKQSGEAEALKVIDLLKETGFQHATKAGISIGLHDLTTPIQKSWLISESQLAMNTTERDFIGARITATERSQRIIDTWHRASESLSKQVVDYFGIYDRFNPVYIMALSGARGNFSQVRQLIGMRGLMADQQGKIVNFPIRSNLREGLTLTEYFISCSGARKGLVDTALRTADTGYLTRRLVDVSHHVVVKRIRCNTNRGIAFKSLQSYNKILLALKERLVGRVLAEDVFLKNEDTLLEKASLPFSKKTVFGKARIERNSAFQTDEKQAIEIQTALLKKSQKRVAKKDQEISLKLALKIAKVRDKVYLRSPLTCGFTHSVCQLCYGWSISQGSLVSLGDAVGVIAAQSIGEPGTQLTMRTFHTGGVFSGDLLQEIRAPHAGKMEFDKAFQGLLIRTAHGRIAFLSKTQGSLFLKSDASLQISELSLQKKKKSETFTTIPIPAFTMLFVRQGEKVENNQLLAEFSIRNKESNQPIKTQQTIFAELSGRVIEDCSGKIFTKSIKESAFLLDTLENNVESFSDAQESAHKPYADKFVLGSEAFNSFSNRTELCKKALVPKSIQSSVLFKDVFLQNSAFLENKSSYFCYKKKGWDIKQSAPFIENAKSNATQLFFNSLALPKIYVPQLISSFSSYNGYISAKKLNNQTNFSCFKTFSSKKIQKNFSSTFKLNSFDRNKIKLCNFLKISGTKKEKALHFLSYNKTWTFRSCSFNVGILHLLWSRKKKFGVTKNLFIRGRDSYGVFTASSGFKIKSFALVRKLSRFAFYVRKFRFVATKGREFCSLKQLCKNRYKAFFYFRNAKALLSRCKNNQGVTNGKVVSSENHQSKRPPTDIKHFDFAKTKLKYKEIRTKNHILFYSSYANRRFAKQNLFIKSNVMKPKKSGFLRTKAKTSRPYKQRIPRLKICKSCFYWIRHAPFCNINFKVVPYKTLPKLNSIGLGRRAQRKTLNGQFLRLCTNKQSFKILQRKHQQITNWNVVHAVQNKVLQKIFNKKLNKWSNLNKRFIFLNEVKKKQSSIYKAQILFSHKSEDLESDTFKYIEPVISGRLGFLKILSTRVGATLDYMSPIKLLDQYSKKRKCFSTFGTFLNKTVQDDSLKDNETFDNALSIIQKTKKNEVNSRNFLFPFSKQDTAKKVQKQEKLAGLQNILKDFSEKKELFKFLKKESVLFSSFTGKYLHPESKKENRFFLQTIAEYGDIVEEGYSFTNFTLNQRQ